MDALEVMDFNSFWNIWFWGTVVVAWSLTSHFILGVPYDLVIRAGREGGQAEAHCDALAHAQVYRITGAFEQAGLAITCVAFFSLAAIGTFAFWVDVEAARALFFLLAPLTLVYGWSVPLAFRIRRENLRGVALRDALGWRRLGHQVCGMLAIILVSIAAVWELTRGIEPLDSAPF